MRGTFAISAKNFALIREPASVDACRFCCSGVPLVGQGQSFAAPIYPNAKRKCLLVRRKGLNMWRSVALLCFLVFLLGSGASSAAVDQQGLKDLSTHRVWHALLHYESSRLFGRTQSAIDSPSFFLSPLGATNPLAELQATIAAFETPESEVTQSAQCRFPARFIWLSEQLVTVNQIERLNCTDYLEWANPEGTRSISMVFATGHMKSPASYFGHNFLKFNGAGKTASGDLLDQTINFGAEVPEDESALSYFYNGIFGGYSAVFERQQFFRHMSKYGEEDLRDVWEYELDLSQDELDIILAHTWELQSAQLTYYFFRENCAYQIAKLLALVSPAELVPQYMPWTMPYNVFDKLMEMEIRGRPVVGDISYHPSRRSRFHQRYFALSNSERATFVQQVARQGLLDETEFANFSLSSKLAVVDALLDYYEFRLRLNNNDTVAKSQKKKLLLKRFQYPVSDNNDEQFDVPYPPHRAQKPGYLSFSKITNSATGGAAELNIRPAYFDFLSLDIGRSSAGNFTILDTTILADGEGLHLRKLDLLNITNLSPSVTGVGGDSGRSWHFRLGFDRPNNACNRCRRLMADAMIGKASQLRQRLTGFALVGARLQRSFQRDNTLALRFSAGVAGQIGDLMRLHASIERHEDTGGSGLDRNRLSVQLRLGASSSWDVRLGYVREVAEEFSITAGYYW